MHDTLVLQWSEQHYNKFKSNKEEVFKDKGTYRVEIDIPAYLLNSGRYKIIVGLAYASSWYELLKDGIIFELFDSGSTHALKAGRSSGLLGIPLNWKEQNIK